MSVEIPVSNDNSSIGEKHVTLDSVVNWQLPVLLVLFVSIVFIAIKTVVHRHDSRATYVELQKLEKERDRLAAQWSRLKLEQATTLNQVRVEKYARWDLNMKMPKASEKKIIQEETPVVAIADSEAKNIKVSAAVEKSIELPDVALGK